MTKMGVFIGRFQPLHEGHSNVVTLALTEVDELIIVLGSAHGPRTIKNPWTVEERIQMFKNVLSEQYFKRLHFVKARDYHYNDKKWTTEVRNKVNTIIGNKQTEIYLYGHKKDHTSYYLNLFPEWKFVPIFSKGNLNATDIRTSLFDMGTPQGLPWTIQEYLSDFRKHECYSKLKDEYREMKIYKDAWSNAPFSPRFVTVDSVVNINGHILLIERHNNPGKGLCALPGGFLEDNERLIEGALRETEEETSLRLNPNDVVDKEVFDYPGRSLRGRTITHGFYFKPHADILPSVIGFDDAKRAFWMSIPDIHKSEELFYEDHYSIIMRFIEK